MTGDLNKDLECLRNVNSINIKVVSATRRIIMRSNYVKLTSNDLGKDFIEYCQTLAKTYKYSIVMYNGNNQIVLNIETR